MPDIDPNDVGTLEKKPDAEVNQDFDTVFDEASAQSDAAAAVATEKKEEIKEEIKDDMIDPALASATDKVKPVEIEPVKPVEDKAKTPVVEKEPFEQQYKTLQGIHKHDREVWEGEKAELLTRLEALEKAQPVVTAKATEEKKAENASDLLHSIFDSLSEEQKAQLKEYDEEFDVISKMEGLKREAQFKQLKKDLDDFKAEIKSQLQPAENLVKTVTEEREADERNSHFAALHEAHSDYETYRDDGSILAWIDAKPKYLQDAMRNTYEKGTVEDVISLLNDFKKDNNIAAIESVADNVVHLEAEKVARKNAMTSPVTKRGAVNPGSAVAQDFDGAFDEALNKQGG